MGMDLGSNLKTIKTESREKKWCVIWTSPEKVFVHMITDFLNPKNNFFEQQNKNSLYTESPVSHSLRILSYKSIAPSEANFAQSAI